MFSVPVNTNFAYYKIGFDWGYCLEMADVHSVERRSFNMSRIRAKNTKPEMLVRKFLHKQGLRYRLHVKNLPGKPDLVFPKKRVVIFIHGCFWHGHTGCRLFVLPKTRTEWWNEKISNNRIRDTKNKMILETEGWKVIEVYECELKAYRDKTLNEIYTKIH